MLISDLSCLKNLKAMTRLLKLSRNDMFYCLLYYYIVYNYKSVKLPMHSCFNTEEAHPVMYLIHNFLEVQCKTQLHLLEYSLIPSFSPVYVLITYSMQKPVSNQKQNSGKAWEQGYLEKGSSL